MTAPALDVLFEDNIVGSIVQSSPGAMRFTYGPEWLDRDNVFAISNSLPLQEQPFDASGHRFFANLLPEGTVRDAIAVRLGLSVDNDYALLEALGRECAGALVIVPRGHREDLRPGYRQLRRDELRRRLRQPSGYAAFIGDDVRLSLAGAQDKLAVRYSGRSFQLPVGSSATTHILKFPNRDFAALPENELLVSRVARAAGLPVVEVEAWTKVDEPILVVRRYDRATQANVIERLHQEDLCQALGVDRRQKYEAEGGPSFVDCYRLVRDHSIRPIDDTRALLRWIVFCGAVGNRDNHAKNLALLREATGMWRLAPFFDLVCTRACARIDKRLAMSIGGRVDGGDLSRQTWRDEAVRLDVRAAYLLEIVDEMLSDVASALPAVIDDVATALRSGAPLVAPRRAIEKSIRAMRRALK
jgi:serine/threonine-protein kinase HipA